MYNIYILIFMNKVIGYLLHIQFAFAITLACFLKEIKIFTFKFHHILSSVCCTCGSHRTTFKSEFFLSTVEFWGLNLGHQTDLAVGAFTC